MPTIEMTIHELMVIQDAFERALHKIKHPSCKHDFEEGIETCTLILESHIDSRLEKYRAEQRKAKVLWDKWYAWANQ